MICPEAPGDSIFEKTQLCDRVGVHNGGGRQKGLLSGLWDVLMFLQRLIIHPLHTVDS